jgi:hypothetical protein
MNISEIQKINMFDRYVMRGGLDTLDNIQELCLEVITMMGMDISTDSDIFNDIVTDVIKKSIPYNRSAQ